MKISTEDLRRAAVLLLRHLDGHREFEVSEDFYWEVPREQRYAPHAEPKELTLGQLTDDWSEISLMLSGEREPVAYGLVWLAAILRRLARHHPVSVPAARGTAALPVLVAEAGLRNSSPCWLGSANGSIAPKHARRAGRRRLG